MNGLPYFLLRGGNTTITRDVDDPDGTMDVTVYRTGDVELVTADATVDGGVATVEIEVPNTADLDEGAYIIWQSASGPRRDEAMICAYVLDNPISADDIARVAPALDNSERAKNDLGDYAHQIAEAWRDVQARLLEKGSRPRLILDHWQLRAPTLNRALSIIFEYLARPGNEHSAIADRYYKRFEQCLLTMRVRYEKEERSMAATRPPVIWLG